ncbi:hypothetical protein BHE74_00017454 [Ensete ventricosum]|nr:hypothetical protein BHE74_00017454 [Ensete ventricosum]
MGFRGLAQWRLRLELGLPRCSAPELPNGRSYDMGPPSSAKMLAKNLHACLVGSNTSGRPHRWACCLRARGRGSQVNIRHISGRCLTQLGGKLDDGRRVSSRVEIGSARPLTATRRAFHKSHRRTRLTSTDPIATSAKSNPPPLSSTTWSTRHSHPTASSPPAKISPRAPNDTRLGGDLGLNVLPVSLRFFPFLSSVDQTSMAVGKIQYEESIAAGLEFVHSTSVMGRKRVVLSRIVDSANCWRSPKRLSRVSSMERLNRLEALPQDILVGTSSRFFFTTKQPVFRRHEISEEAPNAPMQQRVAKSRLDGVKVSSVAVALFRRLSRIRSCKSRHFRLLYRGTTEQLLTASASSAAFSPSRHLPPLAAIFNQIRYATPHLFARSLQSAHPYQSPLLLLHGAIGNRGPPPVTIARARPNQICSGGAAKGACPIFVLNCDRTFSGKNCIILCFLYSEAIFHLLPFAATSNDPSSGATAAPLRRLLNFLISIAAIKLSLPYSRSALSNQSKRIAPRSPVAAYCCRTCSCRHEQVVSSDPFSRWLFPFRGSFYRKPPVTIAQRNPSALLL